MTVPDRQPAAQPWTPWHRAWADALYGDAGFYRRPEGPAGHFRTACHAAPEAVAALVRAIAVEYGCVGAVDVGAGRGELATALAALDGTAGGTAGGGPGAAPHVHAVDVVPRPPGVPEAVGWSRAEPTPEGPGRALAEALRACPGPALVTAFELLDVVPCPVVEVAEDGTYLELDVDPRTGRERPGTAPSAADDAWLRTWWPAGEEGDRAEVGHPRDAAWAGLVAALAAHPHGGLLLGVDYAHVRATRPAEGSLSGFRAGREVPPRPDGSTDVTAHVAIDAVEAAGRAAGARTAALLDQADAVRRWWPGPGEPPGELLDRGALGGFSWLVQAVRPGREGRPEG